MFVLREVKPTSIDFSHLKSGHRSSLGPFSGRPFAPPLPFAQAGGALFSSPFLSYTRGHNFPLASAVSALSITSSRPPGLDRPPARCCWWFVESFSRPGLPTPVLTLNGSSPGETGAANLLLLGIRESRLFPRSSLTQSVSQSLLFGRRERDASFWPRSNFSHPRWWHPLSFGRH